MQAGDRPFNKLCICAREIFEELSLPDRASYIATRFFKTGQGRPEIMRSRWGTFTSKVAAEMSEIVRPIKETEKHPAQAIEIAVFKKGQAIMSEGQQSPSFLVILSGQVVLSKNGKIIRTLDEQDIFGLESLLLKKPCSLRGSCAERMQNSEVRARSPRSSYP